MSRLTAAQKVPRALTDQQWVSLEQSIPSLLRKLPKTQQGEPNSMTVQELTTLRTRIEDLRKLNDQLIHHRLPSLQQTINGLHVISTNQHSQLKTALSASHGNGEHEDDEELIDGATLTPEQRVHMQLRLAEDATFRYNKAKERFDRNAAQFQDYNSRNKELNSELEQQQNALVAMREKSQVLVQKILDQQNTFVALDKQQRELSSKHAAIEANVNTLSTQLSINSEQLVNETAQYNTDVTALNKTTKTYETEIVKLQESLKTLLATISQRQGSINHLDEEIEKLSTLEQRVAEYKLTKMGNQNKLDLLKANEDQNTKTLQGLTAQSQSLDLELKKAQIEQTTKLKKIQEAEAEAQKLETTIAADTALIHDLKSSLHLLTTQYHEAISALSSQNQDQKSELQALIDPLRAEMNEQQQVLEIEFEAKSFECEHRKTALLNTYKLNQSKVENLDKSKVDTEAQIVECTAKIAALRNDIEQYQQQHQNHNNFVQQRFLELQKETAQLEVEEQMLHQRKLAQIAKRREFDLQNEEFIAQDIYRRKLHNSLQDLKGNIRVLCRIRPNLPHDGSNGGANPLKHLAGTGDLRIQVKEKEHVYQFETVFGQESTQAQVFTEVQEVVQSAIDGYEVCLFSYGMTGSGKSHTMTGVLNDDEHKGIIPRSVDLIFQNVQDLRAHSPAWDIKLSVSCCQIYLDKLSDLLNHDKSTNGDLKLSNDQIRKKITVQGLTHRPVQSTQQVYKALEDAHRHRVVASTGMNATSSRSHFVFTLYIEMVNTDLNERRSGVLNLCDLAGSERVSSAQTTGDQLKETQKINASLSTLNRVFMELAENRDHIPFRECKLTDLLQYCLSGDGKTLMIVNLSPAPASAQETNGSLQLAQTVSRVQRGQRAQGPRAATTGGMAPTVSMAPGLRTAGALRKGTNAASVPTPMSQSSTRSGFGAMSRTSRF